MVGVEGDVCLWLRAHLGGGRIVDVTMKLKTKTPIFGKTGAEKKSHVMVPYSPLNSR